MTRKIQYVYPAKESDMWSVMSTNITLFASMARKTISLHKRNDKVDVFISKALF